MGSTGMPTEIGTKENGKMTNNLELEPTILQTEASTRVRGGQEHRMVKGHSCMIEAKARTSSCTLEDG